MKVIRFPVRQPDLINVFGVWIWSDIIGIVVAKSVRLLNIFWVRS